MEGKTQGDSRGGVVKGVWGGGGSLQMGWSPATLRNFTQVCKRSSGQTPKQRPTLDEGRNANTQHQLARN